MPYTIVHDTVSKSEDLLENQILELRRGVILLATLSQLAQPIYGYALLTQLAATGIIVDAGTLYPLLRRLEKQGLLDSEWDTDAGRPRKYYKINAKGQAMYEKLSSEWKNINNNLLKLLPK